MDEHNEYVKTLSPSMELDEWWTPSCGILIPDEPCTTAIDAEAVEGLARQVFVEVRPRWAGIVSVSVALGYGVVSADVSSN
ncbi:hypothetical protein AJ78_01456 [Emergomyces pasteurianus Ep9510]|uniref:Uncharacterized protein n=1 Tax=Emergomyces pasteurianus Ep9510 TaxID=1447872 RepID=A0A1J9QRM5_9EURO|nr:hypothetical protein AJ78_01456 [Emergomyces pasteurianus Ep9510]